MAMRLFSLEEFDSELIRRDCKKVDEDETGHFWETKDGRFFMVPHPGEPGGQYPDWMLDDLIATHDLPAGPKSN